MCSKLADISPFAYTRGIGVGAAIGLLLLSLIANPARAEMPDCAATDAACQLPRLESLIGTITESSWRDQTLRELAKLYAAAGQTDAALAILPRIESHDARALSIRGIGMAIANRSLPPAERDAVFVALRRDADMIGHEGSQGIALTYIAMAQALAGDDAGAFATASDMKNAGLRNKAFAENAEIQAGRDDLKHALESLAAIDDPAFRNKAHGVVARIFAERAQYEHAMSAATKITNPFQRSQAILYIMARQITPDDTTLGIRE